MELTYKTVDVFADRQFGGNPLAVVFGGEGLAQAQMQQIAREFNYSETTFVLPPKDPAHAAQVRIFTPAAELPFAGHPNVGTAYVLAQEDGYERSASGGFLFEELCGLVSLELLEEDGKYLGAKLTAPAPFETGPEIAPDLVAACCGLSVEDLDLSRHNPIVCTTGITCLFCEVKDLNALARAQAVTDQFQKYSNESGDGIYLYTRDGSDGYDYRARLFAPLHNIPEDPATGSANLSFAGLNASLDPCRDGVLTWRVAQGVEMGRPSRLDLEVTKSGGQVKDVIVTGRCAPMMSGKLKLE